ncbi:MAG TPA: acetylxylan esterase [Gemmatimonadaceae bacterium]
MRLSEESTREGSRMFSLALSLLCVAPILRAQHLVITPDVRSDIYPAGAAIGWTITLAVGQRASPGTYPFVVKENGARIIGSGALDLARGPARIETSLSSPGVVIAEITPPQGSMQPFGTPNTGGPGRWRVAAAVEPTKIQPVIPPPADFDSFWAAEIAQLERIPMHAVLTPKESGSPDIEYATVRLDNIGGAHVYGQIAKPKRAGRFPALLIMQWASPPYPLQRAWVADHATEGWLAMNVEPHDVPSDMPQAFYDALPAMIRQYASLNNTDRHHNYFLQMYLGDYRAVEYLASRPDWDGRVLVANGTSMGGQQSLVVAGLNPKVSAVIVNVPAGSDALGALHGRMPGYPFWDINNSAVVATAPYFDVTNFASHIKAPTLMAIGFIDDVTPAIGQWTTFNQLAGPKEAAPMLDTPHNHLASPTQMMPYTVRSAAWLKALAAGEPAPVNVP